MIKKFTISSFRNIILSFRRRPESRIFMLLRSRIVNRLPGVCRAAISILFFLTLPSFALAEEKIPVFPTTPVEAYTIYATLALLWLGIIGVIVIIKMKLNEIERIQKLGIDEEDSKAPILE